MKDRGITKQHVMTVLSENKAWLANYKVSGIYLFGSVARDEADRNSDIDILVEFEPEARIGLLGLARLQEALSEMIGHPVDLATKDCLHRALRERILKEAIRAA